jgi:hypothetical protein
MRSTSSASSSTTCFSETTANGTTTPRMVKLGHLTLVGG